MKILRPAHNIPSAKVKNWKEIMDQARALRELILGDKFEGSYQRAYAISHCQVSEDPKWFFVVNETLENEDGKNLVAKLGSWCIINAEIVTADTPVQWREACMSFPFRKAKYVDRLLNVKVRYQIPMWGGWFLVWRTKTFTKLPAFIFQHEIEHARGENIYGLKQDDNATE